MPASGGVRVALIAGLEAAAAREQAATRRSGQAAGASRRRRLRRRVARHPRVPGRQPAGVLPARHRQQRAHADRYRRAALHRAARRRRRRRRAGWVVDARGRAGRSHSHQRPVSARHDRRCRSAIASPTAATRATIAQKWPAAFEQLFVAAEKVGSSADRVAAVAADSRRRTRAGRRFSWRPAAA